MLEFCDLPEQSFCELPVLPQEDLLALDLIAWCTGIPVLLYLVAVLCTAAIGSFLLYACKSMHARTWVCVCACVCAHACVCMRACVRACVCVCVCVC